MDESIVASQAGIAEIETALWTHGPDETLLEIHRAAFRQMERLIARKGKDNRHKFVIVIPVADRPQHLKDCIESLLHLCKAFAYGGFAGNKFQKVSVIIADDSRDDGNIAKNQEIACHYQAQGIDILYFGLSEQLAQLDALGEAEKNVLSRIIGNNRREAFYHKGPSIMRNIVYLKLSEMARDDENILFYFIDSDQEFQVSIDTPDGCRNAYAINYFYYLDQIFSRTGATVLTGKVVGDPPVSPAVMAGNFLEDVICFVKQIAELDPAFACQFHGGQKHAMDDAAYHDMATLFGFTPTQNSYSYNCTLDAGHDHVRCFSDFSGKLNRFFYGEHPTRKTAYQHEDPIAGIRPARTVYTGNYIFKPAALKYFIPFATLKLRMAGPVLGRLIQSEIKDRFISANLPMLHKRTVGTTGMSEFRPGISAGIVTVDLSGEFERQFYGDVMLFTIEKLIAQGYPKQTLPRESIMAALASTHEALQQQYGSKRMTVLKRLDSLKALVYNQKNWWNRSPEHAEAIRHFTVFMDNIAHNFGDDVYAAIHSPANKAKRHTQMVEAISRHAEDSLAWTAILAQVGKRA